MRRARGKSAQNKYNSSSESAQIVEIDEKQSQNVPSVPDYISIENFNQKARHVKFTEPATLEALKRLGYIQSEFSYKSRNEFKRRTDDEKILDIISASYEKRRQEMIAKVIAMRQRVIDEDTTHTIRIPGILRREKLRIEQGRNTVAHIEQDTDTRLQKIAFAKLHVLAMKQATEIKTARNQERFTRQHELNQTNMKKKHEAGSELIRERASFAKLHREKLNQEQQQKGEQVLERAKCAIERKNGLQQNMAIERMHKICTREERVMNARHKLASSEHLNKLKVEHREGDMSMAESIIKKSEKVQKEKMDAIKRFNDTRKKLNQELDNIMDIDDPQTQIRIQEILNLRNDEMDKLIETAKQRTGGVFVQQRRVTNYL